MSNLKNFLKHSSDCNVEIYDLDIQAGTRNEQHIRDEINLKNKIFHGVNHMLHYLKPEIMIYPKIENDDVIHGITITANKIKGITKIQLPLGEIAHAVEIMADLSFEALKSWYFVLYKNI